MGRKWEDGSIVSEMCTCVRVRERFCLCWHEGKRLQDSGGCVAHPCVDGLYRMHKRLNAPVPVPKVA